MKWSCPIIFICHLIFLETFTEYPYLFSTYMNHKTINRFLYYTITVFINLLNSNRSNSQARPNKG